jgi:hypothetical protein
MRHPVFHQFLIFPESKNGRFLTHRLLLHQVYHTPAKVGPNICFAVVGGGYDLPTHEILDIFQIGPTSSEKNVPWSPVALRIRYSTACGTAQILPGSQHHPSLPQFRRLFVPSHFVVAKPRRSNGKDFTWLPNRAGVKGQL